MRCHQILVARVADMSHVNKRCASLCLKEDASLSLLHVLKEDASLSLLGMTEHGHYDFVRLHYDCLKFVRLSSLSVCLKGLCLSEVCQSLPAIASISELFD